MTDMTMTEPVPEQTEEENKSKAEEDQKAIADIALAIHRGMNPTAPDDADNSPYMEFAAMYYWATNRPAPEEPPSEEEPAEAA